MPSGQCPVHVHACGAASAASTMHRRRGCISTQLCVAENNPLLLLLLVCMCVPHLLPAPSPAQARIITESTHPYRVVFANHAWEELCGWTAEEIKGSEGLSFLQGPDTEKAKLKRINEAVKYGEVRAAWPPAACWVVRSWVVCSRHVWLRVQ